jgi:hypothetical protein
MNHLGAFYNIMEKREVLFFYFVPETTHETYQIYYKMQFLKFKINYNYRVVIGLSEI